MGSPLWSEVSGLLAGFGAASALALRGALARRVSSTGWPWSWSAGTVTSGRRCAAEVEPVGATHSCVSACREF